MSIYRQRMQFVTALDRYSLALTAWDRAMVDGNFIDPVALNTLTIQCNDARSALIQMFCGNVQTPPLSIVPSGESETAQGAH